MMAGEMPGQDQMEQMEKLYQVLNLNPLLNLSHNPCLSGIH